ncbi:hypothetical protein FZEAL_5222 [Fusarium zealandicum]|uniref:Fungal N-terminal domain-containing protein n=1 Tax=Fusarium zealandicum TaxID=1053134 RepID=A0A8H4UKZ8_9HYPO|nr:hypothetical protein FZEAL_5222 [Fusarium zealandicum]
MGDPLSVAGTAVGITSLGIQVCHGLLVYADAVRGREQDVADGKDEVESLLALFKSLDQTIDWLKKESPEKASSLLEHLRQNKLKERLGSLEKSLEDVGILVKSGDGLRAMTKNTYRAAVYPIKKSKIEGARKTVQTLLASLTAALQTVGLDLQVSQNNALEEIQSTMNSNAGELKVAVETNSHQLNTLQLASERSCLDLNSSMTSNQGEIRHFASSSAAQMESVGVDAREGVENTRLLLQMVADMSLQLRSVSQASSSRATEDQNLNRRLIVGLGSRIPPSSLKQACDLYTTNSDLDAKTKSQTNQSTQSASRRKYCKCPRRARNRGIWSSRAPNPGPYFEQTHLSDHRPSCPFAKFTKKASVTKIGLRVSHPFGGLFSSLIDISLCLTRGAGGYLAYLLWDTSWRGLIDEQSLGLGLEIVQFLAEAGNAEDDNRSVNYLNRTFIAGSQILDWIVDLAEPENPSFVRILFELRSMNELERLIEQNPESTMERTDGYTTLELAINWEPGLMRLLQTKVRHLIHDPDIARKMLRSHVLRVYPNLLDAFLDAGLVLFPFNDAQDFSDLLYEAQTLCVQVIAKHLAERLRSLNTLASNLGIVEKPRKNHGVLDFTAAAHLCLTIENMGEVIDPILRIPTADDADDVPPTIYHLEGTRLEHFQVFYENGFEHIHIMDSEGFPPVFLHFEDMIKYIKLPHRSTEEFYGLISWLERHGGFRQKPHDPLQLGLNVHATGAHYIASSLGLLQLTSHNEEHFEFGLTLATGLMTSLDHAGIRDDCVCWCNPNGEGCSPLSHIYKVQGHQVSSRSLRIRNLGMYLLWGWRQDLILTFLFGFDILSTPNDAEVEEAATNQISTRALEVVRLLTFEALEMRHTCCMLKRLDAPLWRDAIMDCDPFTKHTIREDPHEQESALLLDSLMEEFTECMRTDYRGETLQSFIFGPWLERIQDLYVVQEEEVQTMERHLGSIQTGVWPEPLRRLLWPKHPYDSDDSDEND